MLCKECYIKRMVQNTKRIPNNHVSWYNFRVSEHRERSESEVLDKKRIISNEPKRM